LLRSLDGWQNKLVFLAVFSWSIKLALARGDSVVGIFNRRADAVVVGVLRKWQATWLQSCHRRRSL
jgi:hypothetical protein